MHVYKRIGSVYSYTHTHTLKNKTGDDSSFYPTSLVIASVVDPAYGPSDKTKCRDCYACRRQLTVRATETGLDIPPSLGMDLAG